MLSVCAAFGWPWGGSARPPSVATPAGLATMQGFDPGNGRLTSLAVSASGAILCQLQYGWDVARDLKLGRSVVPGGGSLASSQGYAATYDAVSRMRALDAGAGNQGGPATPAPLETWAYGYGKADELLSITQGTAGLQQYASGPEGEQRLQTFCSPTETLGSFNTASTVSAKKNWLVVNAGTKAVEIVPWVDVTVP